MFDLDSFIVDCQSARQEAEPIGAIRAVLDRALASPGDVAAALPATRAELSPLLTSSELTIMLATWTPGMQTPVHDHLMSAVIGVYQGQEDNDFYRSAEGGLAATTRRTISVGQTAALGSDTIHRVTNPSSHVVAGAIHVYTGDFLATQRSVWTGEPLEQHPADGETMRKVFESANEAYER